MAVLNLYSNLYEEKLPYIFQWDKRNGMEIQS